MPNRGSDERDAQIVLASASPRRRALLRLLGVSFAVRAGDVDEEPRPGEGPAALTTRLARSKALAVASNASPSHWPGPTPDTSQSQVESPCATSPELSAAPLPGSHEAVVLGADTVVVLDGVILGKPADDVEATAMLAALRGRAHRVLTGVALAVAGQIAWSGVVETPVWMRAYGEDEMERYVRSGSPLDKAGAYGIQDADFRPVERIAGCFANVVGLPLCEVRQALTILDPDRIWGPGWSAARREDTSGDTVPERSWPEGDCALCERARELS